MVVWKKVWPVLGVLCALLSGCGGDDGGGLASDSSTVNTSGTEGTTANTLSVNVRQVLTSFHTKAGSYTLIGSVNGVDQQLTLDVKPITESFWSGDEVETVVTSPVFSDLPWQEWSAVAPQLETKFLSLDFIFFRLVGADWDAMLPVDLSQWARRSFLPSDAQVGASGPLGTVQYYFVDVHGPSFLLPRYAEFTYSVEAASSADTAWVCENSKEIGSAGVVDYRHQLCVLMNSSSELLGVRFAVQTFDANGLLKKSGVFNAS